mgnify:CR=1 FL=1
MSRKNIPQIDALVQRTFAQKMWDNGFHPYKDHTEWLRLVDGNILQIALFYEYLTIDLRVEYYAQTLSEYLWCNYRQSNIRGTLPVIFVTCSEGTSLAIRKCVVWRVPMAAQRFG